MQKMKLIIALLFMPLLAFAEEGPVKTAISSSNSALKSIWNYKLFEFDNQPIEASSLFIGLISLIIGIKIARYCSRHFKKKLFSLVHLDKNSANLLGRMIDYILLGVIIIIVLDISRVPLTIFTFIGGAFAVSIGLSSQHLVNNFISGIALIVEGRVKVGDLIELGSVIGRVDSIESRVVEIKTQDNIQVFIPHSQLMQEQFKHWTYNGGLVRLSAKFRIEQENKDSNDNNFADIILNAVMQSSGVLTMPKPQLLLAEMDHNILCYEVRLWVNLSDSDRNIVLSEVNQSILNTLSMYKISLAIPSVRS